MGSVESLDCPSSRATHRWLFSSSWATCTGHRGEQMCRCPCHNTPARDSSLLLPGTALCSLSHPLFPSIPQPQGLAGPRESLAGATLL